MHRNTLMKEYRRSAMTSIWFCSAYNGSHIENIKNKEPTLTIRSCLQTQNPNHFNEVAHPAQSYFFFFLSSALVGP